MKIERNWSQPLLEYQIQVAEQKHRGVSPLSCKKLQQIHCFIQRTYITLEFWRSEI